MSRPLPFHVTLGKLSAETREKLAKEKLNLDAVRDSCSKAACQGLNMAIIPLGAASLVSTETARTLTATLKGFSFEWVEGIGRDGLPSFELRISWPFFINNQP
jgi:hypothetical protein